MSALNDVSELRDRYFTNEYIPSSNLTFLIDRVSTKEQKDKSSPKIQKRGGNEYTKKNKLDVMETFSMAETAYYAECRKIFNEIIKKIKKSHKTKMKIMHLVLSHASRASRNKLSTNLLRSLVLEYGVVLHYFRDNLVLHKASTQDVWDRWEKLHASSEEDNNERRRNSLEGMLEQYQDGYAQYNAPFGYKSVLIKSNLKGYALDYPFCSYVERAFNLAVTGDPLFKKKLDAEFKGIIDSNKIPHKKRLMSILRDPFYYGDFNIKGVLFHGDPKRHPPLISKNLWKQVQGILEGKGRNVKSSKRNLSYTGTIKCGGEILDKDGKPTGDICGGSVSGEMKRDKSVTWSCGCSKKRCSQRSARYMKKLGSQRYFSDEKIEEMLYEIIKEVKLSDGMLDWFKKKVEATVLEESDFNKNKVAHIQANITKKETARKNLVRDRASRGISDASFKEVDLELVEEITELQEELKSLEEVKDHDDWIQAAILEKISNLEKTFNSSPGYTQNKIVLSFCNKVVLNRGELIPDFKEFIKFEDD
ncbi:MAG: recombinase family protein [Bacteriovorax sp.]|nr:recombinase family protein [Bacteriovorax sp.]